MLLGIVSFLLFSFSLTIQDEWVDIYKTMTNPTDPKADIAIGKSLYAKHCKSCHGKEGYGDGPKAEEQDGDLGGFLPKIFRHKLTVSYFIKQASVEMISQNPKKNN